MKILHVVDSISPSIGGPARSVTALADAMVRAGAAAAIAANEYRELSPSLVPRGARTILVPARRMPFRLGAWSPGLRAALDAEIARCDLVHIHGIWLPSNHLAARLARVHCKPYVVSPRGMLEAWSTQFRKLRKQIVWTLREKRQLREAAALHATSEAEAATIERLQLGRPIVISPNGIDLPPSPPSRRGLEARFPAIAGRRVLLFLSRLHPKKGLDELLRAWSRLARSHSEWVLLVSGDDFDRGEIFYRELAQKLGLTESSVVFTGRLEGADKAAAFGACELFVLPSHSENFGIAIGEALAAGKCVITTTATPWPWIVPLGCGWRVAPGETELERTLETALKLPSAELHRMGMAGPDLIKSRFNWDKGSRILLSTYREILSA